MQLILFYLLVQITFFSSGQEVLLPINSRDRTSMHEFKLSQIGKFGLIRKARPNVKRHFHTGIDILRPGENYENNPIFPISEGIVISIREDGPFAQLIIEHRIKNQTVWSVYEHIAGIIVHVNDVVDVEKTIARFMNQNELNKYGWQFDHFHLEILKQPPIKLKTDLRHPKRYFNSYTLMCYNENDLIRYFYNPIDFFENNL